MDDCKYAKPIDNSGIHSERLTYMKRGAYKSCKTAIYRRVPTHRGYKQTTNVYTRLVQKVSGDGFTNCPQASECEENNRP